MYSSWLFQESVLLCKNKILIRFLSRLLEDVSFHTSYIVLSVLYFDKEACSAKISRPQRKECVSAAAAIN